MQIAPAEVSLTAYDSCRFRLLDDAGQDVAATWEIRADDLGEIVPDTGAYTAPRRIWFARSVVVCARVTVAGDKPRLFYADVKLSNVRALSWCLFLFLAAVATALLLWLVHIAPDESREARFEIAPRELVLAPGQQQQFLVNADVTWSPNARGGLYTASLEPQGESPAGAGAAGTAGVGGGGGAGGAAGSSAANAAGGPAASKPGGGATVGGAGNRRRRGQRRFAGERGRGRNGGRGRRGEGR